MNAGPVLIVDDNELNLRLAETVLSQAGFEILHTKDSQYHRIAVVEDQTSRYLRFDSSFQSGMFVDDPFKTRFKYSDYLQRPIAYRSETKRVLYVGLGGGSAPKRTWRDREPIANSQ